MLVSSSDGRWLNEVYWHVALRDTQKRSDKFCVVSRLSAEVFIADGKKAVRHVRCPVVESDAIGSCPVA